MTVNDNYIEERECDYKGEHYSVRDNGAIMRHPNGIRKRPLDGKWTFGRKRNDGYMCAFRSARVHRIVATAFYGEPQSNDLVVDHRDTNRCNNRPENLRWVTKLENALKNPITLKKILFYCDGDIQKFIANPSILKDLIKKEPSFEWMRTVTSEEAQNAYIRAMKWAEEDAPLVKAYRGHDAEFMYTPISPKEEYIPGLPKEPTDIQRDSVPGYKPSTVQDLRFMDGSPLTGEGWGMTPPLLQEQLVAQEDSEELEESEVMPNPHKETNNPLARCLGWSTSVEFPMCPDKVGDKPIKEYKQRLQEGQVFCHAAYGNSFVYKFATYKDSLLVVTKIPNNVKSFGLIQITWTGEYFLHEGCGTFFEENGALASFTRAQGQEWTGPVSIDDYC